METAIWLYEIERARDPYALMKFDSSGRVSKGMFPEDWTRYVLKLATGAGKTKVMSLLMAWAYFHKLYEDGFRPFHQLPADRTQHHRARPPAHRF